MGRLFALAKGQSFHNHLFAYDLTLFLLYSLAKYYRGCENAPDIRDGQVLSFSDRVVIPVMNFRYDSGSRDWLPSLRAASG